MKATSLFLLFICFACNQPGQKPNSEIESSTQHMETKLIGIWNSDEEDPVTVKSIGKVTMTFFEDGKLTYDIYEEDKLQRMNLVYRVSGDTIITDQPSHPQEQKTNYKFKSDNKLALEFEGDKATFNRQIK